MQAGSIKREIAGVITNSLLIQEKGREKYQFDNQKNEGEHDASII